MDFANLTGICNDCKEWCELEPVIDTVKNDENFHQCINPQHHINRGEKECNGSCQLNVKDDDYE